MVTSALPNVLNAVFPKKSDLTCEEVCDTLRTEWRLYQTGSIPETAYRSTVKPKVSSRKQSSYWQKAFHLARLDYATKEPPTCDMEKFVFYLQKLNSSDSQPKYPFLISLILRFVKDAISQHSSILDIPITRSLFKVVKDSRKRYMANLGAVKSIERKEAKKRELEGKVMKIQVVSVLRVSLGQLQNSLAVADNSFKEGNGTA